MAVLPEQPILRKSSSPCGRKRRTKQRSLTKRLIRPFFDEDESGHTAPLSSEFTDSSNHISLKSCLKHSTTRTEKKKSVSFDSITVNEHQVILGDNPSVSSGPPLSLAWKSHSECVCTVNDYEERRPTRRTKETMLVPRNIREEWLRNAGYARSQFVETERVLNKIKRGRAVSGAQQRNFVSRLLKKTLTR